MSEKPSSFASRCSDSFSGLDTVHFEDGSSLRQRPAEELPRVDQAASSSKTREFKKQESIFRRREDNSDFKRPLVPRKRKYVKYSLEGVEDVTDRSNAQAAFSFLRQLREQREGKVEEKLSGDEKIAFKKPKKDVAGKGAEEAKKGKGKAFSSETSAKVGTKKATVLSHLSYDDEEEET